MKTKILVLSALLLATMGVCGCSSDDDDDIVRSPVFITHHLLIKNAEGIDLLDPENPSGFKCDDITLEYGTKETHPFIYSTDRIVNKWSHQPIYFALRFREDLSSYVLVLGWFDSETPFKKEFVIHWPDNTTDHFCVELFSKNQGRALNYSFLVNGVEHNTTIVELEK